jgi:hypothetical protein
MRTTGCGESTAPRDEASSGDSGDASAGLFVLFLTLVLSSTLTIILQGFLSLSQYSRNGANIRSLLSRLSNWMATIKPIKLAASSKTSSVVSQTSSTSPSTERPTTNKPTSSPPSLPHLPSCHSPSSAPNLHSKSILPKTSLAASAPLPPSSLSLRYGTLLAYPEIFAALGNTSLRHLSFRSLDKITADEVLPLLEGPMALSRLEELRFEDVFGGRAFERRMSGKKELARIEAAAKGRVRVEVLEDEEEEW